MYQIACILAIVVMMMVVVSVCQNNGEGKSRYILLSIFVVFVIGNLYFTLFSRYVGQDVHLELVPFRTYVRLLLEPTAIDEASSGYSVKFLNGITTVAGLILNILLYYPLGYLLPILFPKLKPKHVVLIGCLCSIATEATQYLFKMGWCETDDVIHNTLGTTIGVCVWLLQSQRRQKGQKQNDESTTL